MRECGTEKWKYSEIELLKYQGKVPLSWEFAMLICQVADQPCFWARPILKGLTRLGQLTFEIDKSSR